MEKERRGHAPEKKKQALRPLVGGFLKAGSLGVVLGMDLSKPLICFPRCAPSGSWSLLIGQRQGRVISHCSWFWHRPPGFPASLGLGLKHSEAHTLSPGSRLAQGPDPQEEPRARGGKATSFVRC